MDFLSRMRSIIALGLTVSAVSCADVATVTLSTEVLRDKIKGGWAAQTIGVTYGYPAEFQFPSARIPDWFELPWYDGYLLETFANPGVYDDIYMDLTFVQVFENEGLDAPAQSFADAFANAEYSLWFANQMARYNILNGLRPPESGHWLNNPAADDIDFQIEADFAGLMAPGMVNSASEISDRIGHIMNYGDGWYGGVFIAAMYSLAFIEDDIETIVEQAIGVIPEQSDFHKIIDDVIALHEESPDDWELAWHVINRNWAHTDLGPRGLLVPFNIDAKINAAWVVLGLLYGDGDFGRTMEIAIRAGDDADCNPASAAGILGTIYGYERIPDFWKQGLAAVEDLDFAYTTISLNRAYEMSYRHALEMIGRAGGQARDDSVTIPVQAPATVRFEDAFVGHYPKERRLASEDGPVELEDSYSFEFEGVGFAVRGYARANGDVDHVFTAELYVDGELAETSEWPTSFTTRRFYLFWKYALPNGSHSVEVRLLNPTEDATVFLRGIAIYGNEPMARDLPMIGINYEGPPGQEVQSDELGELLAENLSFRIAEDTRPLSVTLRLELISGEEGVAKYESEAVVVEPGMAYSGETFLRANNDAQDALAPGFGDRRKVTATGLVTFDDTRQIAETRENGVMSTPQCRGATHAVWVDVGQGDSVLAALALCLSADG